jgi:hypothetical protein
MWVAGDHLSHMLLLLYRSTYSHGRTTLLAIQVDAAINSGNSGGPVILGDHVVRCPCLQEQRLV